jgi:hypothetical protein
MTSLLDTVIFWKVFLLGSEMYDKRPARAERRHSSSVVVLNSQPLAAINVMQEQRQCAIVRGDI